MTYDEALAFWYGQINYEVRSATPADLKLERMRAFLDRLHQPHNRLRILHITGTKGKGSTAAFLANVLRTAGYRVGLFTSPHLVHVEERIQVNGQPISPGELAALLTELRPHIEAVEQSTGTGPSFFEIGTALGFLHFVRRRVDFAVVEVGLGGRYDSTNVCRPMVSVITSIGLDHMAQLGDTVEKIAYQKAGIIKPRVPVVSGVREAGPAAVIATVAREQHAPLVQVGRDYEYGYASGRVQLPTLGETKLGLIGEHQASNAAVAVMALRQFQAQGVPIAESAIRTGLATVHWPGRIEVVQTAPVVVLDSAHNVPSAQALVATVREAFPHVRRKRCLFAVSSDKQYPEILAILSEYFEEFFFCRYGSNPRAVPTEKLQTLTNRPAHAAASAAEAWAAARQATQPDDLLVVTGSVFLAGELQDLVRLCR